MQERDMQERDMQERDLDFIVESPISLREERPFHSFAELIFGHQGEASDEVVVLQGATESGPLSISLRQLRRGVLLLSQKWRQYGLNRGDTVCLLRLPHTNEILVAFVYAALSAYGIRVFFPMYLEFDEFETWLEATKSRAVIWDAREFRTQVKSEVARQQIERLNRSAIRCDIQTFCLSEDLEVPSFLEGECLTSPSLDDAEVQVLCRATSPTTECLILTTSGTSGRSKLVRYNQDAFLRSCQSWQEAGLFAPDLLGGRALCLLLAHSMGIRGFWNAVWTRQAYCMIPPEWFSARPERTCGLLLEMQPEHITGGPAAFQSLRELARIFPQLKEKSFYQPLRTAVSSGAPFDIALARQLRESLGIRLANAFGTTETMQIASTLLSPQETPEGLLGEPLPGIRIGLKHLPGLPPDTFQMYVRSPFASKGYLPIGPEKGEREATPAVLPKWFTTGDIVQRLPEGLRYIGRESLDFVKDGFGLKVPRQLLLDRYADLSPMLQWIECFPLREEPGLAALLFVASEIEGPLASHAVCVSPSLLTRMQMALEKRHETLLSDLEDLDFRHLTIDRFACIVAQPERTAKGNIDQAALQKHYHDILEILCGRKQHYPGVVFLERDRLLSSANARFTSPRKSKMLELASLDKSYVSALGDKLSYTEGGAEKEVVDFVGGFGAGLLGHRHPELIAIAQEFLGGAAPLLCDQGSARDYQGQLARRLSLMVGRYTGSSYVVRFGSTGAEAVEMALLHAFQERAQFILQLHRDLEQSYVHSHPDEVRDCIAHNNALLAQTPPKIIAIQGAFHGHSLGARAVLAQTSKREPFLPLLRVETIFVSPDAASNELDTLLARESLPLRLLKREQGEIIRTEETISSVFAAIAEPLRGEGGILPVSSALLKKLASSRFPLIMDEIQTGLGRTGRFLASEESPGHYFLFSKSLGGGVAKISALLIERNRYIERFDDDYSSTFAGDSFSCAMATRTLEIIERDDLPSRAHERGQTLRRALEEVQREYPHIVGAIRGEGLMLGVEFTPSRITNNAIWRGLNRQKLFGAAAASYLLNCHQVRVLPTLSAPNVLRVEPSAYIDDASIRQLARGLREFCHGIVQERMDQLLAHLVDKDREQVMANRQSRVEEFDLLDNCDASTPHALLPSVGQSVGTTTAQRSPAAAHRIPHMRCVLEEPNPGAIRVAFINHFVYPERELVMAEPSMARLSEMARRALFHRLMEMMEFKALPAFGRNLMNGQVWFLSLSLAIDAATLEALHREQELQEIHKAIRDAVQYARDEGCRIIALGGYTSILTRDGTVIPPPPDATLTTGNSLTSVVAVERILSACRAAGIEPDAPDTRLAVLGASGNIGSSVVRQLLFAPRGFHNVLLLGRQLERLHALLEQLYAEGRQRQLGTKNSPLLTIETSLETSDLKGCNAIVIATSSNDPLVYPHHLHPERPILLADVSVPGAISSHVQAMPNVHIIPLSGTVAVPGETDFVLGSHIRQGTVFSCAAEAILLGLEPDLAESLSLTGPIASKSVDMLRDLATRHHFLDEISEGGFKTG